MLMRLGRWLRMLGRDAANPDSSEDRELMRKAAAEGRTLLTRDRRLADSCRASGISCILIESSALEEQLKELSGKGIPLEINPVNCTLCNGILRKFDTSGRQIWQCEICGKQYWEGSHWQNIEKVLERVRSGEK